MDESEGRVVHDTVGNHDGKIFGQASWNGHRARALTFNGEGEVRIPYFPSATSGCCISISLWFRGRGADFHINPWHDFQRTPYFQIAGDRIYMASSRQLSTDLIRSRTPYYPEQLWTGVSDVISNRWNEVPRTFGSTREAIEPKLQITRNQAQYEYFGQDRHGIWQIWTAKARANGSQWRVYQRSHETARYGVEQEYVIQVVGDRVFYFWPRLDDNGRWQIWTASSRVDGTQFVERQRSWRVAGLMVAPLYFQVVANQIYYLYGDFPYSAQTGRITKPKLYLASSNMDGSKWHVFRVVTNATTGAAFVVNGSTLYLAYIQAGGSRPAFYLARMNKNGSAFRTVEEKLPDGFSPIGIRMQPVGNCMYYAISAATKPRGSTIWTAQSNLDGSSWKAQQRSFYPGEIVFAYRQIQVVGAKAYYGVLRVDRSGPAVRIDASFAEEGSNLINEGDAFGIGVSEDRLVQGFINAGQDYLYRAEAPQVVAGAVVSTLVDERWHYVVMTYNRRNLSLYLDGHLTSRTIYRAPIGPNSFPLRIGDGFRGMIRKVAIYNRALSAEEAGAAR